MHTATACMSTIVGSRLHLLSNKVAKMWHDVDSVVPLGEIIMGTCSQEMFITNKHCCIVFFPELQGYQQWSLSSWIC